MNIGFISTRLAGVDGVSLETEKIALTLQQMGHQCFYCAGEMQEGGPDGLLVPRMGFSDPVIKSLYNEAFRTPFPAPKVFRRIYAQADSLRDEIASFVEDFNIDVLVSQNASTIPLNLPLGVALRDFAERTRIPTICHHHDFFWERDRFLNSGVSDILDTAFPPRGENIWHLVISTIMQRRIKAWYGIDSLFLPNVFDFENPPPPPDEYAQHFREDLELTDEDLIVLQPTRVVRRKAIEKAIELVRKLNDPRLILLITGYEGDEPGGYGLWLKEEAERSGIRYRFIADWVGARRGEYDGHRVYTLWDIYPYAHFITYPSTYEGFGNALIETLYFRKPLIVHRYPAFQADIRSVGVQAVEFTYDITEEVLAATRRMIDDEEWRERVVDHNYRVGLEHFSYRVLREKISYLLELIEVRQHNNNHHIL